ncbi:MAG: hypothetical protein GY773_14845, partial [Actinomycetia bacterium]|nr:hypothetical protein [Actinomycetes bacterium]
MRFTGLLRAIVKDRLTALLVGCGLLAVACGTIPDDAITADARPVVATPTITDEPDAETTPLTPTTKDNVETTLPAGSFDVNARISTRRPKRLSHSSLNSKMTSDKTSLVMGLPFMRV